ncbi:MAG TPA: fibronectin type III domain-containing protein, partial [Polyangiales bacterium]|nr:fibronectin type III domain-containing protein [Polyangiales bacterium]
MRRARSALLWAIAVSCSCGDDPHPREPSQVEAEVSDDIATVVNVRWATGEPSIGYVEYGLSEKLELKTPLEKKEREQHALQLLGLKPDHLYYYRVVTWDGDDAGASEIQTIRSGDLPVGMPRLELEGSGHDLLTLVPVLGRTTAVLVIDGDGEIVWYHTDDRDLD